MSKDLYSDFRKFATSTKVNGRYASGLMLDDYSKKFTNYQSPMIYQTSADFGCNVSIFSKLIENRVIFINDFDQESADIVCGQLLYLNNCDANSDISLYIDSFGGEIYSLRSILSSIDYIPNTINTVGMGVAASCGSVLLAYGDYGHRFIQSQGTVLVHQPLSGCSGPAADMEITVNEVNRLKKELFQILADRTGHTIEEITDFAQRDKWLSAQEALDFHIVDKILEPQPQKIITYNEWLATKEN